MNSLFRLGTLFGLLSRVIPQRIIGKRIDFLNGYYTGRWKGRFKCFGNNSVLCRNTFVRNPNDISVGSEVKIQEHCIIETWPLGEGNKKGVILIGDNCDLGEYTHITAANKITLGADVLTGRYVLITDNAHGDSGIDDLTVSPVGRKIFSKGPVVIGDNVWIGDKVSIMPGVTIGDGSIIAANAVVTHDIPPYSVAAGVPAKVLKTIKN